MYIAITDTYGQIVSTYQNSKLTVSIVSSYLSNPKASEYSPTISGNTNFYSENGIFNISGLTFTGTPGQSYSVTFQSNAIDETKPANSAYLQQLNNNSNSSS